MIFRTSPIRQGLWKPLLGGALTVLIAVPLCGALLLLASLIARAAFVIEVETDLAWNVVSGLGLYLLFSPLISIVGVLVATPFAALAARRGWAGLGTAMMTAGLLGALAGLLDGGAESPAIVGAISALFSIPYWLGAQLFAPVAADSLE